jgi:putative transposase
MLVAMTNPFRYFNSSPDVIRLVVMMYVRYPLSLRNVEDLLAERGVDISHETVRFWWNRFGPMFAAEIRKKRVAHSRGCPQWRWHLDEVFVKVNGKLCYLWRAVDHEGEVLEAVVTAKRDKTTALKLLKRVMKRYGAHRRVVTDGFRAYSAAMNAIRAAERHEVTAPDFECGGIEPRHLIRFEWMDHPSPGDKRAGADRFLTPAPAPGVRACATGPARPLAGRRDA